MSLLPSHKSKFDKKLDEFFKAELEGLDISLINTMALSCHPNLVPLLAKSFDIDISGLSTKSARSLMQNAFSIHYYLGTVYGLKKALKSLDMDIAVTEWYEYGGKPYHFKASINASKTGINFSDLKRLDEIINEYKNVRSICQSVEISQSIEVMQKSKSAFISGEEIEILPYQITNLSSGFENRTLSSFYQDEIIDLRSK